MSNNNTINARIVSTMLGYQDHGILTVSIRLEFDGSQQSFGGYALDKHNGVRGAESRRVGTAYGCEFIARVMQVVGVSKWEDLKGQYIRTRGRSFGCSDASIEAIGHITENKWFAPATDLQDLAARP